MKTLVMKVDPKQPNRKLIARAARIIRDGGLVAFPTETVYGLAANLLSKAAVEKLYRVKRRASSKPFTVHISDLKSVRQMGSLLTNQAKTLADKFWPGPLTMILEAKNGTRIGFRMPANKTALDLIRASGVPVAAPSANISGNRAPTDAGDVLRELDGKIDLLLDAGPTDVGIESTVIDMTVSPPKVVREGAISREKINKAITKKKECRCV